MIELSLSLLPSKEPECGAENTKPSLCFNFSTNQLLSYAMAAVKRCCISVEFGRVKQLVF